MRPVTDCPRWGTFGNEIEDYLEFTRRIVDGECLVNATRVVRLTRPAGDQKLCLDIAEVSGSMADVDPDVAEFVVELLSLPDVRALTIKDSWIQIHGEAEGGGVTPELREAIDSLILDTWNVIDVPAQAFDALEDAADEWPELIG